MTKNTQDLAAMAARRRRVAELYLLRKTQEEIADETGFSQSTVSRDVNFLIQEWRKDAQADIDLIISQELAELNYMDKEAAVNYYDSKNLSVDPSSGRKMEKWSLIRLKVKERKAKLLGLDQPTRLNVEGPGLDGQIVVYIPDDGRNPDLIGPDSGLDPGERGESQG